MRVWRSRLLPWLDSNELPWLPPRWWRGTAREREIWALRRKARRLMWPALVRERGHAKIVVQVLMWPAWAAIKSLQHVRASARTRYAGRSRLHVGWDSYWMQIAYNIRISDQLDVCLNLPHNRRDVRGFMVCREQQALLERAHRLSHGVPGLERKIEFARFCEAHALPTPALVCKSDDALAERAANWPERDLIFKPANEGQGKGIAKLAYDASSRTWRTKNGETVCPRTVDAWARARVGDRPWLIQSFVRNDASWSRFTRGGLATCRVVTARLVPGGEPFLLGAFARFPLDNEVLDNLSAGGIGMGVDLNDGRMTAGSIWVGEVGHHDRHPRTGAQITGEVLAGWKEMAALALRAHRAAGDWCSIGWDVAFTEDGVMLIEANLHWAIFFHQPLSKTRFAEIVHATEQCADREAERRFGS